MQTVCIIVVLCILSMSRLSLSGTLTASMLSEQSLIATLLTGYKKETRPSDDVDISTTISLKQIISIDEKNQIMTSSCYISQQWIDPRLEWDPVTNNGIETIMTNAKNVWLPDTFVLNTADTDGYLKLNSDFTLVSIHYNGQVYLILPTISLKTRCSFNTRNFPFDNQVCKIIFSSWSQDLSRVQYDESQDALETSGLFKQSSLGADQDQCDYAEKCRQSAIYG